MEQALVQNLTGLYNLVNNQSITKYDLLCLFNKYFRNNEVVINRSESLVLDKTLICSRNYILYIESL